MLGRNLLLEWGRITSCGRFQDKALFTSYGDLESWSIKKTRFPEKCNGNRERLARAVRPDLLDQANGGTGELMCHWRDYGGHDFPCFAMKQPAAGLGRAEKQHCYQESGSWAPARSIVENRSLPRRGRRCGSSGLGAGSLWTGRKVPGEGVLSSENRNTQGCREPYENLFGLQLLQNHLHFQGIWISGRGILFLISIFLPMLGPEFVVQKGKDQDQNRTAPIVV